MIEADEAEERAAERARGESQRDSSFGFGPDQAIEGETGEDGAPPGAARLGKEGEDGP